MSVEKKETEVSALLALLGALFLIAGSGLSMLWYHRVA
jgi:Ca-activated chloride channel family protein